MRFTLQAGRWYAAEMLGDEFRGDRCAFSPIRVNAVEGLNEGKRTFRLDFYHANYPEGVRSKCYTLETIARGEGFILARSCEHSPSRYVQIYSIDWAWLNKHFGVAIDQRVSVEAWLEKNA